MNSPQVGWNGFKIPFEKAVAREKKRKRKPNENKTQDEDLTAKSAKNAKECGNF
jgi:hypothetical protein